MASPLPTPATRFVQLAYHVPDPEAAALLFARQFGWGPFFLMEHIPLTWSRHRGTDAAFDHSSAYGQGGGVMIELITQHNDGPSALRDMFGPKDFGLHHCANFVDDLPAAIATWQAQGNAIALEAETQTGVQFAMVDTRQPLGHMLELYEPSQALTRFYSYVRAASDSWDGAEPLRRL